MVANNRRSRRKRLHDKLVEKNFTMKIFFKMFEKIKNIKIIIFDIGFKIKQKLLIYFLYFLIIFQVLIFVLIFVIFL